MFLLAAMHRWASRLRGDRSNVNRSGRRRFAKRLGAATVEMALVTPFVLAITFGSIEFSRVIMVKQALTNSAREGCRIATLATTQSKSVAEQAVRDYLSQSIAEADNPSIVQVTVTPRLTEVISGDEIQTYVEIRFADVSWLPAMWAGNTTLIGSSKMNRE